MITFIQTGGTIDKDYPPNSTNHGYNFEIGEPAFTHILATIRPQFEFETMSVLRKDSLDITDADRELIRAQVEALENNQVVITHGTDTIRQTAEVLAGISAKTIVLTGSMTPEKFKGSDAEFNLGMAVAAAQTLPPGVYIALRGQVTPWQTFVS